VQFKEKFIAYVDILGFKQLVAAVERGERMSLPALVSLTAEKLGRPNARRFFEQYGPRLCPAASYIQKDLDFVVTQVSDCAIFSAEVSPAGGINLIGEVWLAVTELLVQGHLCRGYITRGNICHTEKLLLGTGYQNAFANESGVKAFQRNADERGTPFVEVDATVRDYLANSQDACVRDMFARHVKTDGIATALFPIQQFCSKFAISAGFDAAKQKASNNNLRQTLRRIKGLVREHVDHSNIKAVQKSEHYLNALDVQLEVCDQTDRFIDALSRPFGQPR
jgi:hypothetical protein